MFFSSDNPWQYRHPFGLLEAGAGLVLALITMFKNNIQLNNGALICDSRGLIFRRNFGCIRGTVSRHCHTGGGTHLGHASVTVVFI